MTDSANTWFNNESAVLNVVNPSVSILPRGAAYAVGDLTYVKGVPIILTEHFYNTIYLDRKDFKLTAQEFAEQILERQLKAVQSLIIDYEMHKSAKYIAYAAPKLSGACSGYITRGTVDHRWFIHSDGYGAPVSTVDVLVGSSK